MLNHVAILTYGVLTLLMTFSISLWVGSFWGAVISATAAGITYVFQVLQEVDAPDWLLNLTWLLVVAMVVTAWVFAACA